MATKKKKHTKKIMRNGYTPKKTNTFKENVRNDKAFGKTKREMYEKGITDPKEWSKRYRVNKRKEEIKDFLIDSMRVKSPNPTTKHKVKSYQEPKKPTTKKREKVEYKRTILDVIAENRSRDVIYKTSNEISKGIMILFKNTDLSNDTINFLRSGLTFLISEGINKMLEKELSFVDKTELFFNIGKTVYKIIVKINENEGKYFVDYRYEKATILDTASYNRFKKNRNKEIDKYFDYNLSTISALNRKLNNKYILFIIKHDEKFVFINKDNKNQFITTKCQKENFNMESAYNYLSNQFNIENIKLVNLGNYVENDKDSLNEYIVVYMDVNTLFNNQIIIDDINENMSNTHKKIYYNFQKEIEELSE